MRQDTLRNYIGRGIFCAIGCVGLVPNIYFLLFPIASIVEGYFVPDLLYLTRLGLLVIGAVVSILLLFGASRGWRYGSLLALTALLIAEYAVVRLGLLN